MDQLSGWRVATKLEKGRLLLAINSIAALSIFFFGYDQVNPNSSTLPQYKDKQLWSSWRLTSLKGNDGRR